MMYDFYNEKNDYFSIIASSFALHIIIVLTIVLVAWLKPPKEPPPPIPFFELINVAPPPPAPAQQVPKQEVKPPEPPPPPPEPVKEIKPELPPEPKPEPTPPKPTPQTPKPAVPTPTPPTPTPPVETPVPEAPAMEMPTMDMPKEIKKADMNMPALRTLGNITMDPQMQAYLERLTKLIYQNFNPPSGTEIAKGTKTSIAFKIERNGEISEVILRSSSGNSVWDRLSTRAIQITKAPPLPSTYTAENLPLIFDFREK